MYLMHLRRLTMGRLNKRDCKRYILWFIIGLVLIGIMFKLVRLFSGGYMPQRPVEQKHRDFEKYIMKYSQNFWQKSDVKKILLWTPFFGSWSWLEHASAAMKSCPVSCQVTNDRSTLSHSDAVLFHAIDLWKYKGLIGAVKNVNIEMPQSRSPNQVWVLYSYEPMAHMWGKIQPNVFNWTMVYRRDATVFMPFTSWTKKSPESISKSRANRKPKPKETYLAGKTKFATTLVSNCYDQGKRYRTIRELQQYVQVDAFGHCYSKMVCPKGMDTFDCGKQKLLEYKFYLAFENSYCRDYVSEKFWNALERNQIPVIAAPDYNLELLPKKSYLNVFDFASIKDLADRMKEIGENEELFSSFFDWRQDWEKRDESYFCKLCEKLHSNMTAQTYMDMEGWIQDDMCQKASVWNLASNFIDRTMFDLGLS